MKGILAVSLALVQLVSACGDSHDHSRRAYPSSPLPKPTRPLEWGDINIIHTTDSHGWLLGHQKTSFPEPNYSGDLGDFASFVQHMKEIAIKKDVDLLLVDSGDLHEGDVWTDGLPGAGVDPPDATEFLKQLPYDVMTIGNHELTIYANTLDMHQNFAPALKGRYLSSNVNITYADEHNNVVNVPVGSRYAKFKTRKGRQVTAFGVIFDFTGNDQNTTVQKVEDMVKEAWFSEAIQSEPDLFLLAGHMPVARDNWPLVFNAIRAVHPTTPILILGGHTHIRDCLQLDGRSMSLESGRYMETIGFMSAKLDQKGSTENITFSRRYLDPNRVTYEYHTGTSNHTFDTPSGVSITKGLLQLAEKFGLNTVFGTAPRDYTINRDPYPSNGSSLSLLAEQAIPLALSINNTRASIPNIIITNSGNQRFDIYKGPFTVNDQFTVIIYPNAFFYIPEIPLSVAVQVLPILNQEEEQRRSLEEKLYGHGYVEQRYMEWLRDMDQRNAGEERRAAGNLTLGYVTTDSCPGVGDDIPHAPLAFFDIPDFIASKTPDLPDDTPIDLLFGDFFETQVLQVLNQVQTDKIYTTADVSLYSPVLVNQVLGLYAQAAWN